MKIWMWINTVIILSSLPLIAVSENAAVTALIAGAVSTAVRMTVQR